MFYRTLCGIFFILTMYLFFKQLYYFIEFKFYIKNINKIVYNENFLKSNYLKLSYNYNLARAKYIYEIYFITLLKIFLKKYKKLNYFEI